MPNMEIGTAKALFYENNTLGRRASRILFVSMLAVSLVPMLVLSLFSFSYSKEILLKEALMRNEGLASNLAVGISEQFDDKLSLLNTIREIPCIREMDPVNCSIKLSQLKSITPDIESIALADLSGRQIARSDQNPLVDISDREHFQRVLTGSDSHISSALISRSSNEPAVMVALPIRNASEETVGVITAVIKLHRIHERLTAYEIGRNTRLFVVDSLGNAALHPEPERMASQEYLGDWEPVLRVLTQKTSGTTVYRHRGAKERCLAGYSYITNSGWGVIVEQDYRDALYLTIQLHHGQMILTIVLTLLTLLVIWFVYTRVVLPLKLVESEGRRMARTVEQDQYKTEFYANITHELRTPLNVILGTLQLLDLYKKNDSQLNETLKKPLRIMRQNCYRVLRLVNNLIDFTKIDAGFYKLHLKVCDAVQLVEEITLSVADYIEHKGIQLVFDTDTEELMTVCDPDKVERIVLNLLSNAAKFTPQGGTILVTLTLMEDRFRVTVTDNGCGIPAHEIKNVFERFRQTDILHHRNNEGSGIGLSLVKSFVEMHEGHIQLDSETGRGTSVSFTLPVCPADQTDQNTDSTPRQKGDHPIERIQVEFADVYRHDED